MLYTVQSGTLRGLQATMYVWHSPGMSLIWYSSAKLWHYNCQMTPRLDPSLPRNHLPDNGQPCCSIIHGGWRICGKTFQKLHGIGMIATTIKGVGACEYHNVIIIILISGKDRFMAVKAHFLAAGLTTRVHKRTKCLPHNACSIFR